ncbi:MAG: sensor histidine kinase [Rhodoferax sp.]|uniref:sensor histidine kinase n=1 Tax=Rhodoferax sp. TaxID=50421 RepID=UPI00261302A7|nr:sensor histidine kinase [Rhodoferax sp.]MDD5332744.1 sensor histidine kinase [Rhodoferax sp.]
MRLLLTLVVALLMASTPHAAPLALTADMRHASLEGRLEHFADASNTLAFEAVRQREFTLLPTFRGQGYDAQAHWYRLRLDHAAGAPTRWILAIGRPTLDELDVWVEQPGGGFRAYALGDHRPYEARPLQTRLFTVPVDVGGPIGIYMRVRTTSSVTVNAEVWQPEAFVADETRSNLYHGMYFGTLLIVVVFYLMLGAWLRDAAMGAYTGYVASLVVMHLGLNGYLPVLFVSDGGWLNDALSRIGFLAGTAFFVLMWARLLELQRGFPRINRLYQLFGWVNVAVLPFAFLEAYRTIAPSINLVSVLAGVANPILLGILWRRDRRAELLVYFIAFIIPMVGGLTHIAMEMAWLPQNGVTSNIYQAASLVHVLVMSFGLALRLRQMQHDKAAAEQGVLVAAQRTQEQRRFVAMLSHEFRNPLAAIDRSAQMIAIKTPDIATPEAKRLAQIRGNVATLSGLVDNFLLTEALDHQAMALTRESCAIHSLLDGAVSMQRETVGERLVLIVVPPDARFNLDPTLTGMAVGNLVTNALRYSPSDSTVEIAATVDSTGLCIRVADRGSGMREEELALLGQPYYRAGSSLGKKGSGLGYYFTRRIVEAHGGSLHASSRPGGGMEVTLRLPA